MDARIIRESRPKAPAEERLARLEERFKHELMDADERLELRERIVRLRRKLSR